MHSRINPIVPRYKPSILHKMKNLNLMKFCFLIISVVTILH